MRRISPLDQHAGYDVILDTNLLLLLIAGNLGPRFLSNWNRVSSLASKENFRLLQACLSGLNKIVSTPNIMTEVSHFLGKLDGKYRELAMDALKSLVSKVDERHLPTRKLITNPAMLVLGLADTSQLQLAHENSRLLLLSMDAPMVAWAQSHRMAAINFHHLR